jgi:hypothetical protein
MSDESDYVYYDLNFAYFDTGDSKTTKAIRFSENRQEAIIDSIADYDLSIVRFNISSSSLPIHIMQIHPDQSDVNKSMYSVTFQVRRQDIGATLYTTDQFFVNYSPEDLSLPLPQSPDQNQNSANLQDLNSDYYNIYSYQHFTTLINNTLSQAAQSLGLFDAYFQGIPPPVLHFNPDTERFEIYVKADVYQTDRPLSGSDKDIQVYIYFNKALYNLLSTFYFITQNFNSIDTYTGKTYGFMGMHYQLMVLSERNINVVSNSTLEPLNRYIKLDQFNSSVPNLNSVSSIIFCTDSIPVIENLYSKPHVILNNQLMSLHGSQSDLKLNILTDLSPTDIIVRSNLYYSASVYRYVSLSNSRQPLKNVDISVYYLDKFSIIRPLTLQSGGSCSIKLMFRKKTAN